MNETILVIHPDNNSVNRDIFSTIYAGKGYDVIDNVEISDEELRAQITTHDSIVFLWNSGSEGLLVWDKDGKPRYMIDDTHVDLLRDKRLLSIGGKEFFERHGLSGLHTGTILSSSFATCLYDIDGYTDKEITESLMPLMLAIRDTLEIADLREMKRTILERYDATDAITLFNRNSIVVL